MVENVSFCLARRICMIAENKYHEGKGIKNEDWRIKKKTQKYIHYLFKMELQKLSQFLRNNLMENWKNNEVSYHFYQNIALVIQMCSQKLEKYMKLHLTWTDRTRKPAS